MISAGCLFWLERLQPLFLFVAIASLAWQVWAVRRRPPSLRPWSVKAILATSLALNSAVIGGWALLWLRYR
ncbi:MAG TPA: hypothetical protein VK789_18565 [Bryobacteraceae bacterium]|nr:hypothetical protein [Bryobacteraceae bacterium]